MEVAFSDSFKLFTLLFYRTIHFIKPTLQDLSITNILKLNELLKKE